MQINKENQEYSLFNQFKFIGQIGRGYYGQVFLVQNKLKQQYALKVVKKKLLNKIHKPYDLRFKDQIEFLKQIQSLKFKRIVKFQGHFQDQQNIGLLWQFINGEQLEQYQCKLPQKVFTIQQATKILAQVIKALQQLHQINYFHGNLELSNIYIQNLNGQYVIKLCHFGYPNQTKLQMNDIFFDGIISYSRLAPENFDYSGKAEQNKNETNFKQSLFNKQTAEQDVWAFGNIFYLMLNRELPFKLFNQYMYVKYLETHLNFSYKTNVSNSSKKKLQNCTPQTQDFFKRVLQFDPQKRIKLNQIKKHSLFAKYFTNQQEQQTSEANKQNIIKLQKKLISLTIQNNKLKSENQALTEKGKKVQKVSKQIQDLLN